MTEIPDYTIRSLDHGQVDVTYTSLIQDNLLKNGEAKTSAPEAWINPISIDGLSQDPQYQPAVDC